MSGIGKAVMYLYKHPREVRVHKEWAGKLVSKLLMAITANVGCHCGDSVRPRKMKGFISLISCTIYEVIGIRGTFCEALFEQFCSFLSIKERCIPSSQDPNSKE